MSDETIVTIPNEQLHLLDELQHLLNRQKELVRKGDFSTSEALTEKSNAIVDELVRTKVLEQAEFRGQFERLAKTYRQVTLMVAAEKDRLGKQLKQVGRARKTLRAYRSFG
ncbi:MAG: hypothetical protein ACYSWW_17045 [Planctomycetota bacterium]|jgi:hypothetical protein